MLTATHIIGILLTVGLLLAVSLLSGRKVKDARSFTTGGRAGSWMVCGAILGTLVGGQSTIGTAQLAFSFGLSAWWFTIGAACTLVGIYMRGHYVTTAEAAALQQAGERLPDGIGVLENSLQAFPTFILSHLPAWLGGIALGAMLINILGCGSGLVLGAATILTRDVHGNLLSLLHRTPRLSQLAQTRLSIILLLALGVVAAHFMRGSFINDLGFLSLGLRAAALLLPLSFALWLPGRFTAKGVIASMILGTVMMLAAGLLDLPADPMYYGLAASTMALLISERWRKYRS